MTTSLKTRYVSYVNSDTAPNVSATFGEFSPQLVSRFWSYVNQGQPEACWPWLRSTWRNGYGQFRVGRDVGQETWGAHRFAYTVSKGVIPDGLEVMHTCDVPRCCNPAHLVAGTRTDNMRDAARKGRLHVSRPRRHKVTTDQLAEIDALLAAGVKQNRIAEQFVVSTTWVCLYAKGKRRQYDAPTAKTEAA